MISGELEKKNLGLMQFTKTSDSLTFAQCQNKAQDTQPYTCTLTDVRHSSKYKIAENLAIEESQYCD